MPERALPVALLALAVLAGVVAATAGPVGVAAQGSVPAAPGNLLATPGDARIELTWTNPQDSSITGYKYRVSVDGGATWSPNWTVIAGSGASTTSHSLMNLPIGTEHTFELLAVNGNGDGAASQASAVPLGTLWSASLTVGTTIHLTHMVDGYHDHTGTGSLAPNTIMTSTVAEIAYYTKSGNTSLSFDPLGAELGLGLRLEVGSNRYALSHANRFGTGYEWDTPNPQLTPGDVLAVKLVGQPLAPDAPLNLAGSPGDGSVTLRWDDPRDTSITLYQYRFRLRGEEWPDWREMPGGRASTTEFRVTGLAHETEYWFGLRAVNVTGEGPETTTDAVRTNDVTPPVLLSTTVDGATLELTYDETLDSNSVPAVGDYDVMRDGSRITIDQVEIAAGSTVVRLTLATAVLFGEEIRLHYITPASGEVRNLAERNAPGFRHELAVNNTPPVIPAAPANLVAHPAGDNRMELTWDDPDDSSIDRYRFRSSPDGGTTWGPYRDVSRADASTTSTLVPSLTNGTEYTFEVVAINETGTGPSSRTTGTPVQPGNVAQSQGLRAEPGDGQVLLTWDDPEDRTIIAYWYRYRPDGGDWNQIRPFGSSSTTSLVVSGLDNGVLYTFTIAPRNSRSTADWSDGATARPLGSLAIIPERPSGLRAAAGDGEVVLRWNDPNESAITRYEYRVSADAGLTWNPDWTPIPGSGATTTTYTVTPLTNDAPYTLALRAVTTPAGLGVSAAVTATPSQGTQDPPRVPPPGNIGGIPERPSGLRAAAGDGEVVLRWNDPNESAITRYEYRVSADAGSTWNPDWTSIPGSGATTTTYTVTPLTNGASYTLALRAVAPAGLGLSAAVTATPSDGSGGIGGSGIGGFIPGGGGGGPSGPQPSTVDFEWTVKHDLEALDGDHDTPSGLWSDGATVWILENGAGADDGVYAYALDSGERLEEREFALDERNRAPRGLWSDGVTVWVSDSGRDRLFAYDLATGERLQGRDLELHEDNGDARGIWSEGTVLWVLDDRANALFAYDLDSGGLLAEYALAAGNGSPRGLWSDGVSIWVSEPASSPRRLFAYRLPNPEGASLEDGGSVGEEAGEGEAAPLERERDEDFAELSNAGNNSPRGIWGGAGLMYVVDESDGKVYSYNMPDAIDARLASLTLSGVDIGEFEPGRTDYEGVVGEGVRETTVRAEAVQRRTEVAIDPPDADGEDANGHQVALEGQGEITVTVTSQDGTRTKDYRVQLGTPEVAVTLEAGWNSIQWPGADGASIGEALEEAGLADNVVAVYRWDEAAGTWLGYFPGLQDIPGLNTLAAFSTGHTYWLAAAEPASGTASAAAAPFP